MMSRVRYNGRLSVAVAALVAVGALTWGCNDSSSVPANVTPLNFTTYIPVATGNTRTYTVTLNGATFTRVVTTGAATTINGLTVFPLTQQDSGTNTLINYITVDSSGNFLRAGADNLATGATRRENPPVKIPAGIVPGQTINQTVQVTGTGTLANLASETVSTTFVGYSTVTVPAGTFQNTAEIDQTTFFTNANGTTTTPTTVRYSYAPGVGQVQSNNITTGENNQLTAFSLAQPR